MEGAGKLLEGIASIGWIILIAFVIYFWRREFGVLIAALVARIRAGSAFELGPFKFMQLDIIATAGQPVEEREVGEVTIRKERSLQQLIVEQQNAERHVFLVHYVYLRKSSLEAYDIALYLTGHFNHLEHVTRVEHFLGEGWGDAIFTSEDRAKQFAIKVGAVGSFLTMARVHFYDGEVRTISRFVELKPLFN